MDKRSYIQAFSTEERCLDGRIHCAAPRSTSRLDHQASVQLGRGAAELRDKHREMSQFAQYACGKVEITINAFSMGAWATGVTSARRCA